MIKKITSLSCLALYLVIAPAQAGSTLLYNNAIDLSADAVSFSDLSTLVEAQKLATNFTVPSNSFADTIQFWGSDFDWLTTFYPTGANSFSNFFVDLFTGTQANEIVAVNINGNLSSSASTTNGLVEYTFTFNPIYLIANQNYWLSVRNDTVESNDIDWVWAQSSSGSALSYAPTVSLWTPGRSGLSLTVTGELYSEVPEPTSILLIALGLLGVVACRKKCNAAE